MTDTAIFVEQAFAKRDQLDELTQRLRALERTVAELRAIPERLWEDLSIYPGDKHRVARAAVYG